MPDHNRTHTPIHCRHARPRRRHEGERTKSDRLGGRRDCALGWRTQGSGVVRARAQAGGMAWRMAAISTSAKRRGDVNGRSSEGHNICTYVPIHSLPKPSALQPLQTTQTTSWASALLIPSRPRDVSTAATGTKNVDGCRAGWRRQRTHAHERTRRYVPMTNDFETHPSSSQHLQTTPTSR